MGDVGTVGIGVALRAEPIKAELFELVFSDHRNKTPQLWIHY
jgi:hypothetical protein